MPMALPCSLPFHEPPARSRTELLLRPLSAAGNRTRRRAISSSLLFSWTWVKSLGHLTFERFSKCVFANLVERYGFERNVLDRAVIQLVAFPQEINTLLRVRDDRDHSRRTVHNAVNPQCAHHQSGFTGWKIFRRAIACPGFGEKRVKGIATRHRGLFPGRLFDRRFRRLL